MRRKSEQKIRRSMIPKLGWGSGERCVSRGRLGTARRGNDAPGLLGREKASEKDKRRGAGRTGLRCRGGERVRRGTCSGDVRGARNAAALRPAGVMARQESERA
ncbi:hypothetical protein C8T65DRAFT_642539 [Cerioporus squamosus]|nr:hypothetical protein C8T65DRAFT_642539 [Cerioporus squamosus]